jgi:hypothetical protein
MSKRKLDKPEDTESKYNVGAPVYVKNFSVRGDSWLHGHIVKLLGRMMYSVKLDNNHVVRRHQNQLRSGSILKGPRLTPDTYDDFLLNKDLLEQVSQAAPHLGFPIPETVPDDFQTPNDQQHQPLSKPQRRVEIRVPLRRSSRTGHPPKRFSPD